MKIIFFKKKGQVYELLDETTLNQGKGVQVIGGGWSELEPIFKELSEKVAQVLEGVGKDLGKMHKKQTEFETIFRNIMRRLLDLEGKHGKNSS